MALLGFITRLLLSLFIRWKIEYYQSKYPENQVMGELSWSMGALLLGSILATSAAMVGFIEFIYDSEFENKSDQVESVKL